MMGEARYYSRKYYQNTVDSINEIASMSTSFNQHNTGSKPDALSDP